MASPKVQILVSDVPLDPWSLIQDRQRAVVAGRCGALVVFVGSMRDFNENERILEMVIENYPEMVERQLQGLAARLGGVYDVEDVLVAHRVGRIQVSDPIVVVGVWSKHRKDAFAVSEALVDALKSTVPFWKKEKHSDHSWHWLLGGG